MNATNRRRFLQAMGTFSAATLFSSLTQPAWSRNFHKALKDAEGISPSDLASEEDFWYYIQQSFTVSPGLINLNNGGVSPAPKTVQEAVKRYYDYCNEAPSYFMWQILDQGREPLRKIWQSWPDVVKKRLRSTGIHRRAGDCDLWNATESRR
jgi:hypothetical protein